MILNFILLIIGFALLIKGADFLVDGASALAKRLKVSALVIGLTIVAFGTSAPELIVNIFASINGNTEIAIGNVLGSNICNILLILGLSAIIYPLAVTRGTVWKEIPLAFLAAVLIVIMGNDVWFKVADSSGLSIIDGLVLLSFFIIFLYYTFGISKVKGANRVEQNIRVYSLFRSILMVIGGLAALVLGGKWVVDGALVLARFLGASEALIGLTIVAVGTSLPELVTSVVAALKKNVDIAVGNIVGSNIFNMFFILGISSIIKPLPFSSGLFFDAVIVLIATFLLFLFMFVGKKHILERWQGIMFIVFYVSYIVYLIIRG